MKYKNKSSISRCHELGKLLEEETSAEIEEIEISNKWKVRHLKKKIKTAKNVEIKCTR